MNDQGPTNDQSKHEWLALAASLRRRVNFGWFLQRLAPLLAISALIGSVLLLLGRTYHPDWFDQLWIYLLAVSVVVPVLLALHLAKPHFESLENALVRLESRYGLNNSLSTALAGRSKWPEVPRHNESPLRWNLMRSLVPTLLSIGLLTSSLLIPVTPQIARDSPSLAPVLWQQLEADAQALKDDPLIDKAYPEQLEKRLRQLKEQKPEDWYSHASQEAAAQLAKEHQREVGDFKDAAQRARQAAAGLKQTKLKPGQRQQLAEQMDQALRQLEQGKLKPNQELLEKFKDIDPEALKNQLTPEQLEELREKMKEMGERMDKMQGGDPGEGKGQGKGNGDGEGEGEDKDQNGKGGDGKPQRGPGDGGDPEGTPQAPLDLGKLDPLRANELRPSLGDKLDTREGEHQVERTPHQLKQGGDTDNTGQGGDRILRNRLVDPRERSLLKNYFSEDTSSEP